MSLARSSRGLAFSLVAAVALGTAACAAPADDGAEATSAEAALTSLPTGHFALDRAPTRGSYVTSLTLKPGKKFELEYVRVRETTKPWIWNPWIPVPAREETKLSLEGTYVLYESSGQRIAFEASEEALGVVDVGLDAAAGRLTFTTDDGSYTLKAAAAPVDPTAPFVADCKARFWEGTLRLDRSDRRRGTLEATKRLAGADNSTPQVGKFGIAYTGDTGVEDYMGFEGADPGENKVEFAVKRGVVERSRAGATFDVGLGYSRQYSSYYVHQSMTCTVR